MGGKLTSSFELVRQRTSSSMTAVAPKSALTPKPPSDLWLLAQQGDPQALAYFLNRDFQKKGIQVRVWRVESRLQLLLDPVESSAQAIVVTLIQTGFARLGLQSVQVVRIYGRSRTTGLITWMRAFTWEPANLTSVRTHSPSPLITLRWLVDI